MSSATPIITKCSATQKLTFILYVLTMASLSLQLAQWNWITRADAGYLMGDGKTLATSTVVSYHVDLEQL